MNVSKDHPQRWNWLYPRHADMIHKVTYIIKHITVLKDKNHMTYQ